MDCPVCLQQITTHQATLNCTHILCVKCATRLIYLHTTYKCPICQTPNPHTHIHPINEVKSDILSKPSLYESTSISSFKSKSISKEYKESKNKESKNKESKESKNKESKESKSLLSDTLLFNDTSSLPPHQIKITHNSTQISFHSKHIYTSIISLMSLKCQLCSYISPTKNSLLIHYKSHDITPCYLCIYNRKEFPYEYPLYYIRSKGIGSIGGVSSKVSSLKGFSSKVSSLKGYSSSLEGVNVIGSGLKGVRDSIKGVSDKGEFEGVGYKGEFEGVNDTNDEQRGVNNSIDEQRGVNKSIDEQRGVNKSIYEQRGVNNSIDDYKGVNNSIDEQRGVNTNTNEQQGFNNLYYKQQCVNNSIHEQRGVNTNTNEQQGVNKSPYNYHPLTPTTLTNTPITSHIISHPKCLFCKKYFYDTSKILNHMTHYHYLCTLCDRMGKKHQYYNTYDTLQLHYSTNHYTCKYKECIDSSCYVFCYKVEMYEHVVNYHNENIRYQDIRSIDNNSRLEGNGYVSGGEYVSGLEGVRDTGLEAVRDTGLEGFRDTGLD
ncbi:hypothetical protein CWI36_2153p0010, partial [Hamiltosporidium magnivora]